MPGKRTRPPGVSDGLDLKSETKSPRTPAKSKVPASRSGRKAAPSTPSKSIMKTTPKAKKSSQVVQNRIKVGVDFGTTNSGVAHVMSLKCDAQDVEVIKNWTGGTRNNEQLEKVPSRIAFKAENEGMEEDKFGYEVPAGAQAYTWFKLHLDGSAEKTAFDSDELTGKMDSGLLELPEDMTAEQVTAAYLSKLYARTMGALEKRHTANILKVTPIDFWFTVPATWQEYAIDATRTAAEEAGFGSREDDRLSIITESEAAAIAVLSVAVEKNPELIKVQKNVLICDLGGGTLDFQVLTITKLKPQLQTEETIPGIGGKSGSAYIDCNFHTWAVATFGDAFKKLSKQKVGVGSKFMNDWEVVKKTFNGKDLKKEYQIPLPALGAALRQRQMDSTSYDFEDHSVLVTGAEIARMFEPVVDKAFALIDTLCDALANQGIAGFGIMCLCGGLGSSEYIWSRFQDFVRDKLNGKCEIFTDDRAWSAVVRGAAIRGLSGSLVLSKKAKRSYGIGVHKQFDDKVDKEDDAEECPVMGKRARGYVRGQPFTENMRLKTELYITIPDDHSEEDLIYKWKLFSCALDVAPEREDNDSVKKEGSILLSLKKSYKKSKGDSGDHNGHQAVKVVIVMKMGSERGTLMVEAIHGRNVVGTASIDDAKTHTRQIVSQSAGLLER